MDHHELVFGPVPSRRLGRSLGINNIPPKACTYSCVYCQVGRTEMTGTERRTFFHPADNVGAVERRLGEVAGRGEQVDALTFVPDGEPTLDLGLGETIDRLKTLGIRIAVISNASLIDRTDVREALQQADWVSLKVDTVEREIWRKLNRPHQSLKLGTILEGIESFARTFQGDLVSETMLVRGVNDAESSARQVGEFLSHLGPSRAYVAIPLRPPAERSLRPPDVAAINRYYQILRSRVGDVELLTGHEVGEFSSTGDASYDLLAIMAVRPMRGEAVRSLLERSGESWKVVERLLEEGRVCRVEYEGEDFFLRVYRTPTSTSIVPVAVPESG